MDKVIFLGPAIKEFESAIEFYNSQSEGLGFEFALEVRRTIERIVKHPLAWHQLSINTRRCRTNRFPYGVVYHIKELRIIIAAVMHLHQAPRIWE
jgi:hypothetical protein